MNRRFAVALLLALSMALPLAHADDVPTVGSVTRNNGMQKNGYLIVKTPDILRVEISPPVTPDLQRAIRHYDQVIALDAADPQIRAEAMRRAAYLRIKLADRDADAGGPDTAALREAVAIYQRLLREQADDPANDLAVYQLARAQQLLGDNDAAIASLRELGQRYPDSTLVGDARFRAAELLYARSRYAEAEPLYEAVLAQGKDGPYFAPAQYKLGWTLYLQAQYADAAKVFIAILDADLPPGATADDPQLALTSVNRRSAEFAGDALRVTGLSFAELGGGPAMNRYFEAQGEPRFSTLLYRALGEALLEQRRYTDSAQVYESFIDRHPQDPHDPDFQQAAIAALDAGGFDEPAMAATRRYVQRYSPGTPYWGSVAPPATVVAHLRDHLDLLGRVEQSRAQQAAVGDPARTAGFLAAADWYRQRLALDPADAPSPVTAMHYADALYDGGRTADAAEAYLHVAYDRPSPQAAEAAYAAVQAYQRLAQEVAAPARPAALQQSVAASQRLAAQFPHHAQRTAVQTRAAGDLYELHQDAQAMALAQDALDHDNDITPGQRLELLTVVADAHYAQEDYAGAETAYVALLRQSPEPAARTQASEHLAVSIYRQGEKARDAGDLRGAAQTFQRVGALVPDATIRSKADYDATAALMALKDWPAAERALEDFRSRHPADALAGDVDKKLAYAYEQDGKPGNAADVYARIARRDDQSPDIRRDAAWQAAQLYDRAQLAAAAVRAYEFCLDDAVTQPLDRGMQARRRLADLTRDTLHDSAASRHWLEAIVAADAQAGSARSALSQQMAAQASLEIGQQDAEAARLLALSAPVAHSLPKRKQAVESALDSLMRAAQSNDAEITTAATYEIGSVYQDFGRALLDSERPGKLQGDALEQYQILLEEQADPFEEKAIAAYAVNLARVHQGIWNDWTRRSANSLTELAPARYGKNEIHDDHYESLQ
ncbi:tetratricopeptide repeat protein [Solimonas terrae]|uniref:Tetratricopeptide repeat protein n=1 Tax=Solimonas terrae TaxID=1396819 RepID=A0A6M2BL40_9GAMM|nr:tetratricopeptide repeat protein [Solimonas terrae]NGY03416.1 tetratricopeptide repeat protein [Solimonas terrae]